MKNVFSKIIIFTFIFVLILSSINSVFATEYSFSLPDDYIEKAYELAGSRYFFAYTFGDSFNVFVFDDTTAFESVKWYKKSSSCIAPYDSLLKFTAYSFNDYKTAGVSNPPKIEYNKPIDRSNGYLIDFNHFYANFDIYTNYTDGASLFYQHTPRFINPYIANTAEDLATGKFDSLLIIPNDAVNKLGLHILKLNKSKADINNDGVDEEVEVGETLYKKNLTSSLLEGVGDNYYYDISSSELGINWINGSSYLIYLVNDVNLLYLDDDYVCYQEIRFTVGGLTAEDIEYNRHQELINSNKKTQDAIEENTKTNKSIFEKIGDILSYINPFSDNFFGKKLIELLLNGLKSLFVPEDGFFDTYFSDLKGWFSDRLGFLWTPFDIIIEILNKILNINFSEPTFHIPEINEPFSGTKLISEYDYNLNDLLNNETFNNIHNIYLIGVDAVIIFALINLARKKIEEVFSN